MTDEFEEVEKKYGHLLVVGTCFLLIVATVIGGLFSHWFAIRLQQDFWPIDASRISPNIVASLIQAVFVVLIMALFYPPFKKALDKAAAKRALEIKQHVTAGLNELHGKLDHIIYHSKDIPEYEEPK
jgi:phosphotransferase system  glucose/maltose/N-acetylglucosamine-specific IIC component